MWGAEAVLTIVQGRGWRGDVSQEENLNPVLRSGGEGGRGGCEEVGVALGEITNSRKRKISGFLSLPPHTHPQY